MDDQHAQTDGTDGEETGRDLAVALFFLLWAAVGWISIATGPDLFDKGRYGRLDPGPGLMPAAVLTILTVGGLALAVRPVMALAAGRGRPRLDVPRLDIPWRTLAFFVTVALFGPAMQLAGYVPTTLVFVFAWTMLLDAERTTRPTFAALRATIAATATTLVVHVGFDRVIGAQLP